MNGEHEKREPSPNELAIEAARNPEATSYIDGDPDLGLSEKNEHRTEDGKLRKVEINDDNGELKYQKNIAYEKVDDPEREGKKIETDEVKAISERLITGREKNDQGLVIAEKGKNLDNHKPGHEYEKTTQLDNDGNFVSESGKVTAGEKKGETWETTKSVEKVGDYTRETVTNAGKKLVDSKLVDFKTTEIKVKDASGKDVWGEHIGTNGTQTMEWGKKPAKTASKKMEVVFIYLSTPDSV
jgi:hypothetical protein